MDKFMVTLGTGTGMGQIQQCCTKTATINGKPIATVGAIASHPYGSDVVIEGIPTILLNGQPIAFSSGKTALGGTLLPNTSVKIGVPEPYTGFICSPKVDTEGQHPEGKPVKSEEIKLESDFAWRQIQWQAQNEGEIMFQINMVLIFGEDVSAKALARLYKEAKEGTIDNPPIVVCRNRIHGTLQAGYDNDTHTIYVAEELIRQAMQDNEERHKLLAALVEEYGHHIDYLLRSVYDKNMNKDAKGDEGARYAYQSNYPIINVNWAEEEAASFAMVTTTEGRTELKWQYEELHSILQKYTADRQNGTNDHIGSFEGFYVEDLEAKGGFGHFNIQNKAISELGYQTFKRYSAYLENGNWLRDYSQLIAPFVFQAAEKVDSVMAAKLSNSPLSLFDVQTDKPLLSVLSHEQLKSRIEDVVRIIALNKCAPKNKVGIMLRKDYTNWRDAVGGNKGLIPGFDAELGVSVTYDHCDNPKGMEGKSAYQGIKGCENFNSTIAPAANEICKTYGTKNYLRRAEAKADDAYGAKKIVYEHLDKKLKEIASKWNRYKNGSTSDDEYERRKLMVALGGSLHTLQDFYAHSNYPEIYMNKLITSNVITWTEADKIKDYSKVSLTDTQNTPINSIFDRKTRDKILNNIYPYPLYVNQNPERPFVCLDRGYEEAVKDDIKLVRWSSPTNTYHICYSNMKAFYAPVTSGTYDSYDMLVSLMHMMQSMLFDYYFKNDISEGMTGLKSGELSASDISTLGILETFGEISGKTNGLAELSISTYMTYLDGRDVYLKERFKDGKSIKDYADKALEVPQKMIDFFNNITGVTYMRKRLADLKESTCCMLIYFLVKVSTEVLFSFLSTITSSLEDSIELLKATAKLDFKGRPANEVAALICGILPKLVVEGKYYQSPFARFMNGSDPSHSMMAKDDVNHPVNDLAGKMAIDATKKAFQQLSDGKGISVGYVINHPLNTDFFDNLVYDWRRKPENFERVLRASVTVTFFENILVNIVLATNHRDVLNDIMGKNNFIFHSVNRIIAMFSSESTHLEQEFVNGLNKDFKSINQLFSEAIDAYKASAYYYLDSLAFDSVCRMYIGVLPELCTKGYAEFQILLNHKETKEEVLQIWRNQLDINLNDYKRALLNGNLKAKLKLPSMFYVMNCIEYELLRANNKWCWMS